jgi:thymidylate synthase
VSALQAQVEREPYPFPVLEIIGGPKERIEDYIPADFVVRNYTYHAAIKMEMKA